MNKGVKFALIGLGVVVVGIQFVRPDRSNPPIDPAAQLASHLDVPADVQYLLDRACVDCHTNSTTWPWYSQVAPVSWLVAHDVEEGREHLDLDQWGKYTAYQAQRKLDEIAEEVTEGKMPLPIYLNMHADAKLTDSERARIAQWATAARDSILDGLDASATPTGEHGENEEHEGHDD